MAQEIGASGDDHHLLPDRSTARRYRPQRRSGYADRDLGHLLRHLLHYQQFGRKDGKEGTWEAFYGTWLSAFVLAPVAIYLTYKATNDSGLLDVDWYIVKFKNLKEKIAPVFSRFAHKKTKN